MTDSNSEAREQAFLDAIAAEDDADSRLIYADWLDELGDGRTQYVRAEVDRRRHSVLDAEYWAAKQQSQSLRSELTLAPEWLRKMKFPPLDYQPMFTEQPASRKLLWQQMDVFADYWFDEKIDGESGESEEAVVAVEQRIGRSLPVVLREWYRWAGKHVVGGSRLTMWSGTWDWESLDQLSLDSSGTMYIAGSPYVSASIQLGDAAVVDPMVSYEESEFAVLSEVLLESLLGGACKSALERGLGVEANGRRLLELGSSTYIFEALNQRAYEPRPCEGHDWLYDPAQGILAFRNAAIRDDFVARHGPFD